MYEVGDSHGRAGNVVSVVNASTATIEKFMCVVSGTIVPFTTTVDITPAIGQSPLPVAPSIVANAVAHVVGFAQEQIAPGKKGTARRRGFSFVRVAANALNAGSNAATTTTPGVVAGSTAALTPFYCSITASQTIDFGGGLVFGFTVSHAYGYINCEPWPL